MLILAGLGNPGSQYAKNRHNIGWMVVDAIADAAGFSAEQNKFQAKIRTGHLGNTKTLIVKPQTFMNKSGDSIGAVLRFYQAPPQSLVVFHDELDLAPGKIRVKMGGGHAGHNGLRSIQAHIGAEFRRIRLGIGHPGDKNRVAHYVLHDFPKEDQIWLSPLISACADHAALLATEQDNMFQARIAADLQKITAKSKRSEDIKHPRTAHPKMEQELLNQSQTNEKSVQNGNKFDVLKKLLENFPK